MDAIRRGAMAKMGRALLGGGAALSQVASHQRGLSVGGLAGYDSPPSTPYPSDVNYITGTYGTEKKADDGSRREQQRLMEARHRASGPLRDKIRDARGEGDKLTLERCFGLHERTSDLPALKSTAKWWRDHIAMERAKKRLSVIRTLEDELSKLVNGPLEALEATARDAINAFLKEMASP